MKCIIDYLVTNYGIDINTASTIIITIAVFIIGFFFQFVFISIKNAIERTNQRKIIRLMLDKLIDDVYHQIKYYDNIISNFDIKNNGATKFPILPLLYINDLKEMENHTFYNSFFSGIENIKRKRIKDKVEKFHKIRTSILAIHNINLKYENKFKEFTDFFREYNDGWNSHIQTMVTTYYNMQLNYEETKYTDMEIQFLTDFNKIYADWVTDKNSSQIKIVHDKFLDPVTGLLEKTEHKNVLKFNNLINDISDMVLDYSNTENLINQYKQTFQNFKKTLEDSNDILKENKKIL